MTFVGMLSEPDRMRVERTLEKLIRHDISRWALTGGFATEVHVRRCGGSLNVRPLHDIDFIVTDFDCIPESLSEDFMLRHVHPNDPPGKTLLQCVDEESAVRVDVFRAYGSVMERVQPIDLEFATLGMISREDLTARAARLSWDLCEGKKVAPKYVRDFVRLLELDTTGSVESAWQDHRQSHRPKSFAEAVSEIRRVRMVRSDLLVEPTYSTDATIVCERCASTNDFPLADARRILAILGYC